MPDIKTYDQLINETDSEKVYLAEIEPALKITGWQLAAGQTNTYQASVDAGMVAVRLKEDQTKLVEKFNTADVENNSGSWYFDTSSEILYAHASDSTDPDTHYMTGYFLEVFGTHPRVFNNRHYKPMIARLPEFQQLISERNSGDTLRSSGRLDLLEDSDRPYWNHMLFKYNWLNKRVTVKLGGAHKDYPYSEFKTVARWVLKGNTITDSGVELDVADLKNLFETRIGVEQYDVATYPNLDPSAEGKTIQMAFGQITNGRAVLVDSTVGTGGKWKLSKGPIGSITTVYDGGISVSFTSDLANGEFTLNVAAQGQITADFTGMKDGATVLQKGGEISKYILLNHLSLIVDDINSADFDALDTARNYTLGIYVERASRVDEILSVIENSNHCFFYTDRETGKIRVRTYDNPDGADPNRIILTNDHLFDWSVQTEEKIFHEINILYGKDFGAGESKTIQKIDLGSSYINDVDEGKDIETFIVNKTDAESLGDLALSYYSKPRLTIKADTHIRPLDRNLYDNVEVDRLTRPQFPDADYTYRLIGSRERADKNKKRVALTLTRNLQPGE